MRAGLSAASAAWNASMPVEMGAVGAGARRDLGVAVEQERRALVLDDRRQRLDAVDQRAVIRRSKPQQHRGHIGRVERGGKRVAKPGRVGDLRGHEIKARGRAPRFDPDFARDAMAVRLPPQSGGNWARLCNASRS